MDLEIRMIFKDDPDIRLFWMGLDNQEASPLPCVPCTSSINMSRRSIYDWSPTDSRL
jgi:hypothetical protein